MVNSEYQCFPSHNFTYMKKIAILLSFVLLGSCSNDPTLIIRNNSDNPFEITIDGKSVKELSGNSSFKISLSAGSHDLRAVQVEGTYTLYPSIYVERMNLTKKDYDWSWTFPN